MAINLAKIKPSGSMPKREEPEAAPAKAPNAPAKADSTPAKEPEKAPAKQPRKRKSKFDVAVIQARAEALDKARAKSKPRKNASQLKTHAARKAYAREKIAERRELDKLIGIRQVNVRLPEHLADEFRLMAKEILQEYLAGIGPSQDEESACSTDP